MPGPANSQGPMPGPDLAPVDPCKVIVGPAIVVVPFPDIGARNTAIPGQIKLLSTAMPVHNLATTIPLTNGNNGGTALGVVSQLIMGPAMNTMGSTNFFAGGTPVTSLGCPTVQNNESPGASMGATQIKLLTMR